MEKNKSAKFILLTIISLLNIIFCRNSVYSLEINLKEHNGISAAVRSLLLPGWGQYYNEQKQKTYIIATTVSVFSVAGLYFYNDAEQTYKKYEERGLKNDPLYEEYEKKLTTANVFFTLAVLSWCYGVIDAYKYGEEYKRKYGFNIELLENKVSVKLTCRF